MHFKSCATKPFDKHTSAGYTVHNLGKLVNILDKEEYWIKLEEINRLVEQKNYKDAMEVVDSIDWRSCKECSYSVCCR